MAAEASVSGAVIKQHRTVMEERYGAAVVLRALERISPTERDEIERAMAIGWVPIDAQIAFFEAVAAELDRSVTNVQDEIAGETAERNLRTVWRMLLRLTTDEALVARTPILYSKNYRQGALEAGILRPGQAKLVLSAWPDVPDFTLRGLRHGIEAVLRLAGRRDSRVYYERRPDGAEFYAVWTP